jgi:hypothetical protein
MAAAAGSRPAAGGGGQLPAAPAEVARFFADVRTALERHPSLCGGGGVGAAFLFRIREPPLAWRVDLRSAPGSVRQVDGSVAAAGLDCDCVIEYRAAGDLAAINAGKLDLRKALILQRLKISGNLKALQRFHEGMVRARHRAAPPRRHAASLHPPRLHVVGRCWQWRLHGLLPLPAV